MSSEDEDKSWKNTFLGDAGKLFKGAAIGLLFGVIIGAIVGIFGGAPDLLSISGTALKGAVIGATTLASFSVVSSIAEDLREGSMPTPVKNGVEKDLSCPPELLAAAELAEQRGQTSFRDRVGQETTSALARGYDTNDSQPAIRRL